MAKPPVLKPAQAAAILRNLGFIEVRQRGAHEQYRHPDGRGTTVRFTPAVIYRHSCFARSQKTSGSPSKGSWNISRQEPEDGQDWTSLADSIEATRVREVGASFA